MDEKINYYLNQAKEYLIKAHKELEAKELKQASEKFWGAASSAVKALAEQRRWKHDGHAALFIAVDKIATEKKDEELKTQFGLASALHQNFYEGWFTEGEVKTYGKAVDEFVKKIESIINEHK